MSPEHRTKYYETLKWLGKHRYQLFDAYVKLSAQKVHAAIWNNLIEELNLGTNLVVTSESRVVVEGVWFDPTGVQIAVRITRYDDSQYWVAEFNENEIRFWQPDAEYLYKSRFSLVLYAPEPMPPPPDLDFSGGAAAVQTKPTVGRDVAEDPSIPPPELDFS